MGDNFGDIEAAQLLSNELLDASNDLVKDIDDNVN